MGILLCSWPASLLLFLGGVCTYSIHPYCSIHIPPRPGSWPSPPCACSPPDLRACLLTYSYCRCQPCLGGLMGREGWRGVLSWTGGGGGGLAGGSVGDAHMIWRRGSFIWAIGPVLVLLRAPRVFSAPVCSHNSWVLLLCMLISSAAVYSHCGPS